MAEIKIEKEKTIWPWILLGVVLVGLLLYFFVFRDNDADSTAQTMENTTSQAAISDTVAYGTAYNSNSVADYVAYVNGAQAMGLDHNYTNGALLRLASAVQAKAEQINYDVQADIDRVKELANKITQDPTETTHANSIKQAAAILTSAMQRMQQAKFPDLSNESQEVSAAAGTISPEVLTLEQKEAVKSFFDESADLLQKMN